VSFGSFGSLIPKKRRAGEDPPFCPAPFKALVRFGRALLWIPYTISQRRLKPAIAFKGGFDDEF